MLKINELEDLGYTIAQDPDQAGLFLWTNDQEGCDSSFHAMKEAQADASRDAFNTHNLSKCDNCGKLHNEETLEPVSKLSQRVEPGETMPSGECSDPDCGCLCFPYTEQESDGVLTREGLIDLIVFELSMRTDAALLEVNNTLCLKEMVVAGEGIFKPAPGPLRYVSSASYEHIFTGKTASVTRWVFDRNTETLVAGQVRHVIGWSPLGSINMQDLLQDIQDNEAIDNVDDFTLTESAEMPVWAV